MRELVTALHEEGVAPTSAEAQRVEALGARTIGRAMLVRLSRLPAVAVRLARAVAVLETAELAQAADLAGLDTDAAAAAADLLVAASILGPRRPLSFVHPIVRAGILEEVPPAERMRAHRRAAELLAIREDSAERVAEHLLATEPAGDAWTVARLTEAAREAARRGAPESAVSYLRRVLAEPPPPGARAPGPARAGRGRGDGRPARRARPTCARRSRRPATTTCASAPRSCSPTCSAVTSGSPRPSRSSTSRPRGSPTDAVARACCWSRWRPARGCSTPRRRPGWPRACGPCAAPPTTRTCRARSWPWPRSSPSHANEPATTCIALAQRALAAGPRIVPEPTDLPWFAQATVALIWADAHAEAQVPLDAGVAESRATGDPALFGMSLSQRAWLLLRLGDLQGAEGDARTVLEAADLAAPALYRKLAAAILVNASTEQGELEQAQSVLDGFGLDESARTQTSAVLRLARGRLRLAQERPDEAVDDILTAGRIVSATGSTCPGYLAWRSGAALAHARPRRARGGPAPGHGGGRARARLRRPAHARGRRCAPPASWPAAREGEALLRESLACLEGAGIALERARALAELGVLVRATGRRSEARAMLREALDVAHHAGAAPLADLAEAELRATGAKPRRVALSGVEALTASERRVAELAGDGLTNREIAQALFVTMRTVEGHLTRVFAKLELSSRDELPDVLRAPR